jgi:hypothetical protein
LNANVRILIFDVRPKPFGEERRTVEADGLVTLIGRPRGAAERILTALDYVLQNRKRYPLKLVLSAVATPDNFGGNRSHLIQ